MATHGNITIEQIQPTVLTRLIAYAQRAGKTVNEVLQEMLDERETPPPPEEEPSAGGALTANDWSRELRAWAARHTVSTVVAEDSREHIYEGRGE